MHTETSTPPRADAWRARGGYFSWHPSGAPDASVEIFHFELGDPAAPTLLLVHGFPTSSVDFFDVADRLSERFHVCGLDFPGYGFSEKPRGWGYSLARDAELVEFYLSEIVGATDVLVVAHDRGDSVALIVAADAADGRSPVALEHLVLTNGNIFLPLSNLTAFQRLVLDGPSSSEVLSALSPSMLAEGMGATTFTPPRSAGDPEVEALAATFGHDDGVGVLHETIQYLIERASDERKWLEEVSVSAVPTTLVWGLNDTVSPVRVASFVWNEYFMLGPGRNRLYFIPDANHYLQNDRPDAFVDTLVHALGAAANDAPGPIGAGPASPLLVDCSRDRLPTAAESLGSAADGRRRA
jgi:pimeloyl-ACP methyl ester carboxylesterase